MFMSVIYLDLKNLTQGLLKNGAIQFSDTCNRLQKPTAGEDDG
jgi:hypothetical protein